MFTYQYTQPNEYHYSLDSIHLAEFVSKTYQSNLPLESVRVLDLCAGCGVIGLELSWYLRNLRKFDFIEVQDIYTEYFYKNSAIVNRPELQLNWILSNYDLLLGEEWREKYDLIISNPPYFLANHGMLSPSHFKNRCRFYLDSTFENFIHGMINALAKGGKAYFLLRSLKQHGNNMYSQIESLIPNTIHIQQITEIRGTDVVLMEKQF